MQRYILPGPDQSLHFICAERQEKNNNKGFQSQAEVCRWAEPGYIMSSQNKKVLTMMFLTQ